MVLTSLEEDFKKIGLIQEGLPAGNGGEAGSGEQGHAPNSGRDGSEFAARGSSDSKSSKTKGTKGLPGIPYKVGGDRMHAQSASRRDPNLDYSEDAEQDDDLAQAYAEAEDFARMVWESVTEANPHELVVLTDAQMEELESMGDVEELPEGIIEVPVSEHPEIFEQDYSDDEDSDDSESDDDEGEDLEFEEEESEEKAEHAALSALNALQERVTSLAEAQADAAESALPTFANIALIAEMLSDTFAQAAEALEDEEYAEMAEGYAGLARFSAEVVDFLESEDDVDYDAVQAKAKEFTETLMTGVRAYTALVEESDDEDEDDQGEG